MAIDLTSTTQTTSTGAALSNVASQRLTADYESFLKLLTAQLMNQDPLEPMDSSTFVSQLAQLSQVEQSIQTNTHLESIAAKLDTTGLTNDLGLIGREVTVPGDTFDLVSGLASFDYAVADGTDSVRAIIRNSAGELVGQIDGLSTAAGELHTIDWTGVTPEGEVVEDGIYTAEIIAADAEGNEIAAQVYTSTVVTSLTISGGTTLLDLANGEVVLSSAVLSVR